MYNLSCDYASKAAEKNSEILKEANIEENCEPVVVAHQRKVRIEIFEKNIWTVEIFQNYLAGLVLPCPVRHGLCPLTSSGDLSRQGDDGVEVQGGRGEDQQLLLPQDGAALQIRLCWRSEVWLLSQPVFHADQEVSLEKYLGAHWSSSSITVFSLVERFIVMKYSDIGVSLGVSYPSLVLYGILYM